MNYDNEYWKTILGDGRLAYHNYNMPVLPPRIKIKDSKEKVDGLYRMLIERSGGKYISIPQIDELADWLGDNKNKGLLLYGNCGRGKTFLAEYVIRTLLLTECNLVANFWTMTQAVRQTDQVLSGKCIILDDMGTENQFSNYGTIRDTMNELVDAAEQQGKLLILTTNFDDRKLLDQYKQRCYDRLCKLCRWICFPEKQSLRR